MSKKNDSFQKQCSKSGCSVVFSTEYPYHRKRYCSPKCARYTPVKEDEVFKRRCSNGECGVVFSTSNLKKKYCSMACKLARNNYIAYCKRHQMLPTDVPDEGVIHEPINPYFLTRGLK